MQASGCQVLDSHHPMLINYQVDPPSWKLLDPQLQTDRQTGSGEKRCSCLLFDKYFRIRLRAKAKITLKLE